MLWSDDMLCIDTNRSQWIFLINTFSFLQFVQVLQHECQNVAAYILQSDPPKHAWALKQIINVSGIFFSVYFQGK